MKVFFLVASFIVLIAFGSCEHSNSESAIAATGDSIRFFPVTSFIQTQLAAIDSLPVTVMYVTTMGKQSDTTWINKSQRDAVLKPFTEEEINQTNLKEYFIESSFKDATINAITLSYKPFKQLPDSIHIKKWDVYIDPDKGRVKKIYLEKAYPNDNLQQHLIWQSEHYAKIITLKPNNKGSFVVWKEEKILWNFSE